MEFSPISRVNKSIKFRVNNVKKRGRRFLYRKAIPYMSRFFYEEYRLDKNIKVEINNCNDGYFFAKNFMPRNPTIYSIGIGSNINFGNCMIKKCESSVFGFDPTKQSKNFIEREEIPKKYQFFNLGISHKNGRTQMKHLKPPSETYLAGTVLDVEGKSTGVETIETKRLSSVMNELGHEEIDMLKIDAEGAEYGIIDSMIEDDVLPSQIVLEYHPHILNFQDGKGMLRLHGWKKTAHSISRLKEAGYLLCHRSSRGTEFLFVHERTFDQ